jgi:C1A family cysteine protease
MKLACLKELYDPKSLKFDSLKSNLITSNIQNEYCIPEFTPISNQLDLGSCVANSTADAFEILLGEKTIQLSRLFIYWNARNYDKSTNKDNGTYIRNAFASLRDLGVCPESIWDYKEDKVFIQPCLEAYRQANDNKITGFYRIDSIENKKIDDVELAIRSNHPVVFGTELSQEFINANKDQVFDIPEKSVGRHAMVIVGVRDNGSSIDFKIRNSWGNSWGDNGHIWFNESYIKWNETNDLWVPTIIELI